MNLIIDIGNSSTKLAVYDMNKMVKSFSTRDFDCEKAEKQLMPYKLEKAIISTVRNTPEFVTDLMTAGIPVVHILTHKSRFPFSLEYDSPETLGTDRIAAVAGAFRQFSGENVLVIDAGTAITFDFLVGNAYKGGNISPGMSVRFRALHHYTGKLPLVSVKDKYSSPGKNTGDAIAAGVITGIIYEINEYIRTFEKQFSNTRVVITGGDSGFLKGKINQPVTHVPDIVLDGLNYILEYNVE